MTPADRELLVQAVLGLLGEAQDIIFHESAEPGDWAYTDTRDDELLTAAGAVADRLGSRVDAVRDEIRRARRLTNLRRTRR
ncbi:hypothetical protein [Streptomyces synnematoformans]|uniref:Uncharacterized protein n=1 Tax=Streptomyces synnematoformans TaxID=415721 RepID=A0ABN2XAN4_9ACTN